MQGSESETEAHEVKRAERALHRQRALLLRRLVDALDPPMAFLGFVWLALLVVDLVWGLNPLLRVVNDTIWVAFIVNFALEFVVAPAKLDYLRRNWLTALSLAAPALRLFRAARFVRALRAARTARGLRLLRIVSSVNRGLGALGTHMSRRGFGYVSLLTLMVTLAGSAGMYGFEGSRAGGALPDYATALWWTAMIMTTMGSEYWPRTAEGRLLCLLLALYAFAVFGYVTAALASFFVGQDKRQAEPGPARDRQLERLAAEVNALRDELRRIGAAQPAPAGNEPGAPSPPGDTHK